MCGGHTRLSTAFLSQLSCIGFLHSHAPLHTLALRAAGRTDRDIPHIQLRNNYHIDLPINYSSITTYTVHGYSLYIQETINRSKSIWLQAAACSATPRQAAETAAIGSGDCTANKRHAVRFKNTDKINAPTTCQHADFGNGGHYLLQSAPNKKSCQLLYDTVPHMLRGRCKPCVAAHKPFRLQNLQSYGPGRHQTLHPPPPGVSPAWKGNAQTDNDQTGLGQTSKQDMEQLMARAGYIMHNTLS